jgi:hypothetical protein
MGDGTDSGFPGRDSLLIHDVEDFFLRHVSWTVTR